jgi:fluoride exporter
VDTDTPPDTPRPVSAPIEDLGELPDSFRVAHPRIGRLELAAVGAGGAVGALGRVGLAQAWPSASGAWPWATLAVNIAGALLLGCLMTALRHGPLSIPAYRLLGTGFCGALTTFSTMQLELLQMLDRSRYGLALGYTSAGVLGGYAAVALATRLTASAVIRTPAEAEA